MTSTARKSLAILVALVLVAALAAAAFVWSGAYNVAADDPHTRPVHAVLETLRERSIESRAARLTVPDLDDQARITQGAGNYDAMCTGCHLAPGMAATELSRGLYPSPPDLTRDTVEAAEAFWVIKHGIKASGMPAWGTSMEDPYIWNMVAFLQRLPTLDQAQYRALVASSGGHSHGGGETAPHEHGGAAGDHHADTAEEAAPHAHPPGTPAHDDTPKKVEDSGPSHAHPPGTPADHHATQPDAAPPASGEGTIEHRHADGTVESHPAPQPAQGDDGHDGHQH